MKILDLFDKLEDSPSEWREFQPGVRFLIRAVPIPEQRRMNQKYLGKVREIVQTPAGPATRIDLQKSVAWDIERASLALVDSENAELGILGPTFAAQFSAALGEPVKPGDLVKLDGRWNQALKELVLELGPVLVAWINKQAEALAGQEAAAEEGKEHTS